MALSEQLLGGFKTGMTRSSRRGGKDGAQKLYTLQNGYVNDQGDVVPRPGLRHVANVAHSVGLYGTGGKLHVFYGDTDNFADPGNPLVQGHLLQYPLSGFILGGDIPNGVKGDLVSGRYTQNGGAAPVTYALLSGSLPNGIVLDTDGTYRGRLSASGSFSWSIRATDAIGDIADLSDSSTVTVGTVTLRAVLGPNQNGVSQIVDKGDWHLAIADMNLATGDVSLYVDNVLIGTFDGPSTERPPYDLCVSGYIDGPFGTGGQFRGMLWGAGVVNGAMTAAQRSALWNDGNGIRFSDLATANPGLYSMLAYAWQLDDANGSSQLAEAKGSTELTVEPASCRTAVSDAKFGTVSWFDHTGRARAIGTGSGGNETSDQVSYFAWVNSAAKSTDQFPGIISRYNGTGSYMGLRSFWNSDS